MALTNAPTVETERLILRGPVHEDLEPLVAFFADGDRSWGFGGPKNRNDAWRWFAAAIGHWHLQGKGYWTITAKDDPATALGITGLWNPDDWPELELGYVAYPQAEGKGIMSEAVRAARLYAYEVWKMPPLCSLIFPGNDRSLRLAERLGCTHEKDIETPTHGREHLYRHPSLAALSSADGQAAGHPSR